MTFDQIILQLRVFRVSHLASLFDVSFMQIFERFPVDIVFVLDTTKFLNLVQNQDSGEKKLKLA